MFGRHCAYPEASPYTKRDLDGHFGNFAGQPVVWLDDKARYDRDEPYRQRLHFFSDNNALVRRSVGTDSLSRCRFCRGSDLGPANHRSRMEKGYAHDGLVYHSHDFALFEKLQRSFDESHALYRLFGYVLSPSAKHMLRTWLGSTHNDLVYARVAGFRRSHFGTVAKMPLHNLMRAIGHYLGSRAQRLPECVRNWLSGPAHDAWIANIRLANKKNATMKHILHKARAAWRYGRTHGLKALRQRIRQEFNSQALMGSPVFAKAEIVRAYGFVVEHPVGAPYRPGMASPNTVNWFIPQVGRGSGGHLNIFRFIRNLEHQGFDCRIIISGGPPTLDPREVEREIADWFSPESQGLYRFRQRADRPHFDRYRVAHRIRCPQLSNDAA